MSTNHPDDAVSPSALEPLWESAGVGGRRVAWLGCREYREIYAVQEQLVGEIREGRAPETVLLVEHEAVYTIGRTRDQTSLREAQQLPHPVVEINRGGQATFHGPGQLVGYPMLDLEQHGRDLHAHLRTLEELVIQVLASYGLAAGRRDGLTGVWVEQRKIASIGVGVRKWVSMHGFGLNVGADLSGYAAITPCGIAGVRMTSLSLELGREVVVEEVAQATARALNGFWKVPAPATVSAGGNAAPELTSAVVAG